MTSAVIRILVASTNPVKKQAAYQAFSKAFPDHAIHCEDQSVESGVPDQPMNEDETRVGAQNRCRNLMNSQSETAFDYYVSMEGGVDKFVEGPATFAYVCILTSAGYMSTGRSANLPLPLSLYQRLERGEELAHVMDDVFKTHNIRQKGGAIGVFTNHAETRESVYAQAIILALAPMLHKELYT